MTYKIVNGSLERLKIILLSFPLQRLDLLKLGLFLFLLLQRMPICTGRHCDSVCMCYIVLLSMRLTD